MKQTIEQKQSGDITYRVLKYTKNTVEVTRYIEVQSKPTKERVFLELDTLKKLIEVIEKEEVKNND